MQRWGSYSAIVSALFEIMYRQKRYQSFENLMAMSTLHFYLGADFQTRHKSPCRCNCKQMKGYKIHDAIRQWRCKHVDLCLGLKSWCWDDYFRRLTKKICNKCFKNHWHGVGYRRIDLCMAT